MDNNTKNKFSLNNSARIVGAILLFLGILFLCSNLGAFAIFFSLLSIAFVVVGIYYFVDSIKRRASKLTVRIICSIFAIALGFFMYFYSATLQNIFFITFALVLAFYGIFALFEFIKKRNSKKGFAFYIIVAIFIILSGVGFYLLTVPSIALEPSFIYIFGGVVTATGLFQIILI